MGVYSVKVIGYEDVAAESAEEALDKFDRLMAAGYKVSDLRWKVVEANSEGEDK